jgi:LPXTG-motif cell wall-anchored protein
MKTLNILLATPQTDNTSIIIGGSVLLLTLGILYYFNGKKKK